MTLSDRQILLAIVSTINDTGALPVTAKLDFLEAEGDSVSVQQLPGARWADRYVGGGGTRETPFAVNYRTIGDDSAGRADASAALYALGDALDALTEAGTLPDPIMRIEGTDTPAIVSREGVSEVWRATFMLESYRREADAEVS